MKRLVRKEMRRENTENEWCAMQVELSDIDGFLRLSICGSAGYVLTERQARKEALEYWISYFEESAEYIREMNERMGTNFRSARSAAKFVLDTDGEYHGLDVADESNGKVYVAHSCGQIRTELTEWFPECVKYFRWHLNDMRAGEFGKTWERETLPADVIAWVETLPDA